MNIFSNLNLKKNTIDNLKLGTWDNVSSMSASDAGAIRYTDGNLYYYDGSDWQQVGTSSGLTSFSLNAGSGISGTTVSGGPITINSATNSLYVGTVTESSKNYLTIRKTSQSTTTGQIKVELPKPETSLPGPVSIYTADSFPNPAGQNNVTPIKLSSTSSPNSGSSVKVQGDGKGLVSFTSDYAFSGSSVVTTTVSTSVVKVLYCTIPIDSQTASDINNGTYFLAIKHGRNTPNVLVNTWYCEKSGSNYLPYNLIQCDVSLIPVASTEGGQTVYRYDFVYIYPKGTVSQGLIKVVLYCGDEEEINNSNGNNNVLVETTASDITSLFATTIPADKISTVTPTERT